MITLFKNFLKDESGATAIEYGLLIALIAIFIIGGITVLAGGLDGLFRDVGGRLTGAAPSAG